MKVYGCQQDYGVLCFGGDYSFLYSNSVFSFYTAHTVYFPNA